MLALITGGQQGIGLGITDALIAAGWRVIVCAEAADAEVPEGAVYKMHDLRHGDPVQLVDHVVAEHGPISAYVSNAGVPSMVRGDLLDVGAASFARSLDVNLTGAFFLAQAVARHMISTTGPRTLIFVTSVSAEMVSVERGDYCISKAGAAMMAKLFAARLVGEGIGVFDLRPGIIRTPMTDGVSAKYDARIADGLVPAKRWGEPEDIAHVVLPLVRGDMQFATGSVINIDGGLSLPRL
jgi:NAD(P)-dependent dehydrogenase (short-subunit alcohol dehydrogenase family)